MIRSLVIPQSGMGIAIDSRGNIGPYTYAGGSLGLGVNAGASLSIQASDAPTIYDLAGLFGNASFNGGAGVTDSVDLFFGRNPDGPVVGGELLLGLVQGPRVRSV